MQYSGFSMCKISMKWMLYILLPFLWISGCSTEEESLFTLLDSTHTNIIFENTLTDTPEFNILNYLYFYDGGGVAAGDLNNNGLPDLFFVGNMVPDRLYQNQGDFVFEDITESAGFDHDENAWATGVTMADVNGSGYLDIYISRVNYLTKEGANQLFINNGDLTFTEKAEEYGLDFRGYSTQAVFFDYNNNGRLDLFLLNHSFHGENTYGEADVLRSIYDPKAGDKLFRNDGDTFTDVTEEAGIISSALGYGLGVAVSDINKNGWPDIYIGNDFHEDDYLYINNGDGTFTESLYSMIGHTSQSSMGNDIADINNNGYVDIISLDMMPEDHETFMRSGGPDIELIARTKKDFGFGEKNARNTLQINRGLSPEGIPKFSETAFSSGVAKSEWSWAALFFDVENDGYKDLFVTNGMVRRPNDLDFVRRARDIRQRIAEGSVPESEFELIGLMPEVKVPNYFYKNLDGKHFENRAEEWGVSQPSFSSGAVYADLNKNGRLDLVVNNANMPAFIYRNNEPEGENHSYLKVKLNGAQWNFTGIGSKVILYSDDQIFYQENYPTRGFQSSVDHILHFGLGEIESADSLLVVWPDHRYEVLYDVELNRLLELEIENAAGHFEYSRLHRSYDQAAFEDISDQLNISFRHRENNFNDFTREPLIPYKLSTQGPALAVADVNGNGLDDFYIGGAHGQPGRLYIQQDDGSFLSENDELFDGDLVSEDVDALFFDANGNGLNDLYVVSGGSERTGNSNALLDRLYINTGDGIFKKSIDRLPELFQNGSVVAAADYNGNGSIDLFIGNRSITWAYGESPPGFILENDGDGYFTDVSSRVAPGFSSLGMVTDAGWADLDGSGYPELIISGEWLPVTIMKFGDGRFRNVTEEFGLTQTHGLWQSIYIDDLNGNGMPDLIAGNLGTNTRINATVEQPFRLYVNDFDGDGRSAAIITRYIDGDYYPFDQLDELLAEFRDLGQQVGSYENYSRQTISGLFGDELVNSSEIRNLYEMHSAIFFNNGNGQFEITYLPFEAQTFPVMDVTALSADSDRFKDLILGGNLFDVKPSTSGRQDAGYGLMLRYSETDGYQPLEMQESGIFAPGETRAVHTLRTNQGELILIARNDDEMLFFKKKE
jgi:enediyne biosynthesis protein E4